MAVITLPKTAVQQPQTAARLNRANPFGNKVRWSFNGSVNQAGQARKLGPVGIGTDFTAQVNCGIATPVNGGSFTVVMVLAIPQASIGGGDFFSIGSGNGVRFGGSTTGGGAYFAWTASGVAGGANTLVDATAEFDMRRVVVVAEWSPTSVTTYWKRDGVALVSWTDNIAYSAASDKSVMIGWPSATVSPIYAAYIMEGLVGGLDGAKRLINNPWQVWEGTEQLSVTSGSAAINGDATGATLTGTSSLTAGSASGTAAGTASGVTLTGTSSLAAGSATGNATGSFTTQAMENNSGAGLLASTSVAWTWYEGAIGAAPTSTTHGTGTTNGAGVLTVPGLPVATGFLLARTADSSGVYYEAGTPA